jgi:uncharacterized membrane protein YhaH (DUF805 family)
MTISDRRSYRQISVPLLAGSVLVPTLLAWILNWRFLAFAASLPFYVPLVFFTYRRLRNASVSGLWIIPMFLIIHVGPKWMIGSLEFYPIGFISFLPVAIGWVARERPDPATHKSNAANSKDTILS